NRHSERPLENRTRHSPLHPRRDFESEAVPIHHHVEADADHDRQGFAEAGRERTLACLPSGRSEGACATAVGGGFDAARIQGFTAQSRARRAWRAPGNKEGVGGPARVDSGTGTRRGRRNSPERKDVMTSIWISPVVLERLAGSLLHFIWQGAAIALVAAVALRLLRHRPAEWRYAAAATSLFAMLAAPFV